MTVRLNKLLARRGLGARRKCDALIQQGAVRVNGRVVTEPGTQVEPERDRIEVQGRALPRATEHRYFALNKPVGVITTLDDPEGRRTIRDFLPHGLRLFPVGRLDADTSGLLLLTNDGELAHRLMHPRYGVHKLYRVRTDRPADAGQLRRLRDGVEFEPGVRSSPARVRPLESEAGGGMLEIEIHEGRYRQVRRMCEAVGLHVLALHRAAYGPLRLGHLERGLWRELSQQEVAALRAASARPVQRGTWGYVSARGRTAAGPSGMRAARALPPGARDRGGEPRAAARRPRGGAGAPERPRPAPGGTARASRPSRDDRYAADPPREGFDPFAPRARRGATEGFEGPEAPRRRAAAERSQRPPRPRRDRTFRGDDRRQPSDPLATFERSDRSGRTSARGRLERYERPERAPARGRPERFERPERATARGTFERFERTPRAGFERSGRPRRSGGEGFRPAPRAAGSPPRGREGRFPGRDVARPPRRDPATEDRRGRAFRPAREPRTARPIDRAEVRAPWSRADRAAGRSRSDRGPGAPRRDDVRNPGRRRETGERFDASRPPSFGTARGMRRSPGDRRGFPESRASNAGGRADRGGFPGARAGRGQFPRASGRAGAAPGRAGRSSGPPRGSGRSGPPRRPGRKRSD